MITADEIEKRFTYHPPKDGQPERYNKLRAQGELLARAILDMTPKSREQSLALTNLEQAIMWANAAIARVSCSGCELRSRCYDGTPSTSESCRATTEQQTLAIAFIMEKQMQEDFSQPKPNYEGFVRAILGRCRKCPCREPCEEIQKKTQCGHWLDGSPDCTSVLAEHFNIGDKGKT